VKTPHRVLYEVLTPGEYKELCKLRVSSYFLLHTPFLNTDRIKPSMLIFSAFEFSSNPESRRYLFDAALRLEEKGL